MPYIPMIAISFTVPLTPAIISRLEKSERSFGIGTSVA
jgi:hypothetical protein